MPSRWPWQAAKSSSESRARPPRLPRIFTVARFEIVNSNDATPVFFSIWGIFMIRYLYGDQLGTCRKLSQSMFRDRANQFAKRLNWQVTVDADGFERDTYDQQNPLYVIWQQPDGSHGGSMRFLPTTGPVMVNDHFQHLTDGVTIGSPLIWECTRFCISPTAPTPLVAARLMLAGATLGRRFHLAHAVGVFDTRMIRVYKTLGWAPDILGSAGSGRDAISVGLWDFKAAPFDTLCAKAKVAPDAPEHWYQQSFAPANKERQPA